MIAVASSIVQPTTGVAGGTITVTHVNLDSQPPQVGAHALFIEMKICPKGCVTN